MLQTQTAGVDGPAITKLLGEIKDRGVEILTNVTTHSSNIDQRLARLEQAVAEFMALLKDDADGGRTHYTPAEFAQKAVEDGAAKHLQERMVQRWCRERRIEATKRSSGRGQAGEWAISHDEYIRWLNRGLLPAKD
jgi:hypothetical protein